MVGSYVINMIKNPMMVGSETQHFLVPQLLLLGFSEKHAALGPSGTRSQ